MRYYLTDTTLLVRGRFHACSTGSGGGIREVTTLLNHSVPHDFSEDSDTAIERIAWRNGFFGPTFGLLTAVPIHTLCITRYDQVTCFITAGITHPDAGIEPDAREEARHPAGTINIICCINGGMADQGLLDGIITVTEAKALSLSSRGYRFAGTVTDAVIVAAEGEGNVRYAGGATSLGRCIHEAVLFGAPKALDQFEQGMKHPTFYIHSSIGGNRWIEWVKQGCPYYPCHFKGQRCEFCYCPLYPCRDETLGEWSASSGKGGVWSCAPCTLNHQPSVVNHLRRNPEASLNELKSVLVHQGRHRKMRDINQLFQV